MSDGEVVKIARQIEKHMTTIERLIQAIDESNHPRSDEIARALRDQCHQSARATHVVISHLEDAHRWETGDFGIRRRFAQPITR